MTDEPRLWDSLLEQAQTGQLTVDIDGDTFDAIDQAFEAFGQELTRARVEIRNFANRPNFGLGAAAELLVVARDSLGHLNSKAANGPNSADTVLARYMEVAERARAMFQAMRDSYAATEADNASQIVQTEIPR